MRSAERPDDVGFVSCQSVSSAPLTVVPGGSGVERVRRSVGIAAAIMLAATGLLAAAPLDAGAAAPGPQVFDYIGDDVVQTYTVPEGVTNVQIQLSGGEGGDGGTCDFFLCGAGGHGGSGAELVTALEVAPGETLTIVVGRQGSAGADNKGGCCAGGGGGGGGKTSVSDSGTPIAIAGGGGGGGGGGWASIGESTLGSANAGGKGGDSGSDGHTSTGECAGSGGLAGAIQFGGNNGGGNYCTAGVNGGNGSGTIGGSGGVGGSDGDVYASDGGSGGDGVLGGGGGGSGGAAGTEAFIEVDGVGGGGAGGTSSLFGHPGIILEGAHSGAGEVIITPLQGGAPGQEAPGVSANPVIPAAVLTNPRFTG